MKACSECGITTAELRDLHKRLVRCVECGVAVCTLSCYEVVTDAPTGKPVYLCGEHFLLSCMAWAGCPVAQQNADHVVMTRGQRVSD